MDTPAIAAECLLRGLRRGDDLEEKKKNFSFRRAQRGYLQHTLLFSTLL